MWINDSQRFLLEHFDTIHNSPSQLYHSALPFCPSSSWLYECYSSELSQEAKVVKGLSAEWGVCSRIAHLNYAPYSLSYWNNTIAVGSTNQDILILDAITGSQTAVLSGHTDAVRSVTFSSDGTSLVSGSDDKTVKLWDVQTGGVVRTFHGHTKEVYSVSISADNTTIASGAGDNILHLWDIQKGDCYQIIKQQAYVSCVRFSPTNPWCLISATNRTVQQWDTNGHKVGHTYDGHYIAFSPDGTQFVLGAENSVMVHNTNSGLVVAEIHRTHYPIQCCCFSLDHKLVAAADYCNICIWDITGSDPHLVETFIGHTNGITSLVFSSPSTIISASHDKSVRFWQIGASSTGPIVTNPKSTSPTSALAKSTALKAKIGLILPCGLSDRVVQTWGILTGLYKGSLQIPAEDSHQCNTQLIGNKLIFVWYADEKINIWDAEKGELLQTINVPGGSVKDLRVSGDGTKVFCVYGDTIQAWDIWTGEAVGKVRAQDVVIQANPMVVGEGMVIQRIEGSKVWAVVWGPHYIHDWGWDFGIPGSPPVLFSEDLSDRLHLSDNKVWEIKMCQMKDIVTGKVVVQLPRRFGEGICAQWDGHYLVVSFESKEVVILDFSHVSL